MIAPSRGLVAFKIVQVWFFQKGFMREWILQEGLKFEIGNCLCEKFSFFFWHLTPRSPQDFFAASLNLGHKPTKVNWTLSWPSGLQICSGVVLQENCNKRSDPSGQAGK